MTLNPQGLGAESSPREIRWSAKDCALYALGVGAGTGELAFTTDNTAGVPQRMLPTMPVVLGGDYGVLKHVGGVDWSRLVHAEQLVELPAALPVEGSAHAVTRIAELWDKGSAALIVVETEADDGAGRTLFRSRAALFVKGAGGWGGERGSSASEVAPEGEPDHVVTYGTREDQALLYRLSGDRNPLHSDPAFAARAGFDRPILHGLCTFGFTGRALLHAVAGGDPQRVRGLHARFAAPVYPGDTLHVEIWAQGPEVRFRTRLDDGTVVLSNGRATIT